MVSPSKGEIYSTLGSAPFFRQVIYPLQMPTPDGTGPIRTRPIGSDRERRLEPGGAGGPHPSPALPLRRWVQPGAVSREQGAAGVGVPGHTAKFHLDRLVDDGLLDVEFRRLSGRPVPGRAGRPSSTGGRGAQIALSLPQRSYDLLSTDPGAGASRRPCRGRRPMGEVTTRVAREEGHALGTTAAQEVPEGDSLGALAWSLRPHGYEPRIEDDRMVLRELPVRQGRPGPHRPGVRAQPRVRRRGGRRASGAPTSRSAWNRRPGRCCVSARRDG